MGDSTPWWNYVQHNLDKRGWNGMDFERHSGINRSRISAWRDNGTVSPENARTTALTFGDDVLTGFVAAGLLTAEEAKQQAAAPIDPATLSDDELLGEVRRRMTAVAAPTASEVVADGDRYTPIRKSPKAPRKRNIGP